ncbi:MAG: polysaccharide lyase [Pirellulaceae bacterium]
MRGLSNRWLCLGWYVLWIAAVSLAQSPPTTAVPAAAEGKDGAVLRCDFEQPGEWWRAWGALRAPQNTELVTGAEAWGGSGHSLRVTVPRGEHMGTSFAFRFRERLGAEPEEIYFRYYLRFDRDWNMATSGGKLPGISGTYGKAGWGGRPVNGRDGWSARGLFETRPGADSTAIGFYVYHADMRGKYGENWLFTPRLTHGRWYCVEQYCRLNRVTPDGQRGETDGVLRGWIDGEPAFERTSIRFRDVDTLRIEEVWVNVYHGGERPVPREDIHLYLDNFVISPRPIGMREPAR